MELEKDLSGDGGVIKKVTKTGTGTETPCENANVSVHYTITDANGDVLDSSQSRNEPFNFDLGKGRVVKGFELSVASMTVGEQCVVTVAPEYAFEAGGASSDLPVKLELEMLEWRGEDISPKSDRSIERIIVKKSKSKKSVNEGGHVKVDITGRYNGIQFDNRQDVEFIIGEGSDINIPEGVELALLRMGVLETSKILIKPRYAFGVDGCKELGVLRNSTVEYTITFNQFERDVEDWELGQEERVVQAQAVKEKGTSYFKKEKYKLALKMYERSNSCLQAGDNDELKMTINLNIALCHQKLGDNLAMRQACNVALDIQPTNIKALYRRGQSLLVDGKLKDALDDFKKINELEPTNKAAINQIAHCNALIKKDNDKQKKMYANMFERFAATDKQKEDYTRDQQPDVLAACGEWNPEEEERKEIDRVFAAENPNLILLNGDKPLEF